MKKLLVIILAFLCIGCDEAAIEMPSNNTNREEVHVVMTITAYDQADLYEDRTCDIITQTDDGRVYQVVGIYEDNERIQSYKVYLGSDRYGYARVEDFYIIELMDETYADLMTPQIDVEAIRFYEDIQPRSFVYSPLRFDFFLDEEAVIDTVNLKVKTRYKLTAVSYDQIGNEYRSEVIPLYSTKTVAECTVYDRPSSEGKVINKHIILEDYQDKIIDYVVTFVDGQFFNYYTIQEGDTLGYIVDDIPLIKSHPSLLVQTPFGEHRLENVKEYLNEQYGYVKFINTENDEKTLVNMVSGAILDFEGKYQVLTHDEWETNLIAISDMRYGQNVGLEIRDFNSLELLGSIPSNYYSFTRFRTQDNAISFEMQREMYAYWPSSKAKSVNCTGSLTYSEAGYAFEINVEKDIVEPVLKDVPLYSFIGEWDDLVGRFDSDNIEQVTEERLIDMKDGQTVYWYHIITKDGMEGYSYRPAYDFEEIVIPRESSYEIMMADGSRVKLSTIANISYNGIVFNDDFMDFDMYAYANKDYYYDQNFCIDPQTQEVVIYDRPDNPWSDEFLMAKINDEYYGVPESSEIVFYNKIKEDYVPYQRFTFEDAKCFDFIWIDEKTISLYMEARQYKHFYYNIPCVLRKVDGQWTLESELENYSVEIF